MIVFSRAIALQLVNHGFLVVDIQPSKRDGKPVYIFDSTEEFNKLFDELVYNRQCIQLKLRRDELELIVKSLASQKIILSMDADSSKEEKDKVNKLIDVLTHITKSSSKVVESEDDDLIG